MTGRHPGSRDELPLSYWERINPICDEFERAWQAGERPQLEDYLKRGEAEDREAFLRELLALELAYRQGGDELPDRQEYLERFPRDQSAVDTVFEATCSFPSPQGGMGGEPAAGQDLAGKEFGRFQIRTRLGAGSFGTVYRAYDPQFDREVAIKFPQPGTVVTEQQAEAFFREGRAAGQLLHPHIVPVHEAGRHDGTCFIVSAFIEGRTLREEMKQRSQEGRNFTHREVAQLISKLAAALHYAHTKGIIHRDIKPENIMIDEAGDPRIMDFGLAHRVDAGHLESAPGKKGTPVYMSPEQVRGESHLVDGRSDLWAVGVIFYELLAQKRPFAGSTLHELETAIKQAEPKAVRQVQPAVPKDLDVLCLRCLQKERPQRLPSCEVLVDELDRWLRGEPIESRRITLVARWARWCRRNPVVAGMSTAIVLLLIVGTGVSTWLAMNFFAQKQVAEQLLAKQYVDTARYHVQRGEWRQVVDNLDRAAALGYSDPTHLELERIRAWDALVELDRWSKAVAALPDNPAAEEHRGEILFWKALLLQSDGNKNQATAVMRQALESDLQPADKFYLQGLLSPTSRRAVAEFRTALSDDEFHHKAAKSLVGLLILLGEQEQARELALTYSRLFPRDPGFTTALAMVAALEGDQTEVELRLTQVENQFDLSSARQARAAVELLAEFHNVDFTVLEQTPLLPFAKKLLNAATLVGASRRVSFQLPGETERAFGFVFSALKPSWSQLFRRDRSKAIAELEQAIKIHEEGTLLLVQSILLTVDQRFAEAEEAARRASLMSCMLPNAERDAVFFALGAAAGQFKDTGEWKHVDRAVRYAKQRVSLGPVHKDRVFLPVNALRSGKEFHAARTAVAEVLDEYPEDPALLKMQISIELGAGAYAIALEAADKFLVRWPEDEEVRQYRDEAEAKLRERVNQLDALDDPPPNDGEPGTPSATGAGTR